MTDKDKKIIEDAELEGIPIFILTAKDKLSYKTLMTYTDLCIIYGCKFPHAYSVAERIKEFWDWQHKNMDKVKLPD